MTIEVEGTVESIVAKHTGWGADKVFVGVSVKSSTTEDGVSWSTTVDIPMEMIPDELKVGATVVTLITMTRTVEEEE